MPISPLTAAQKTAARLNHLVEVVVGNLRVAHSEGIQWIWDNPEGLTPQEAVDALGVDAVEAFRQHGLITLALLSFDPTIELSWPKKEWDENVDGSVTITATDYVPPTP
jgi:hypothetical protein